MHSPTSEETAVKSLTAIQVMAEALQLQRITMSPELKRFICANQLHEHFIVGEEALLELSSEHPGRSFRSFGKNGGTRLLFVPFKAVNKIRISENVCRFERLGDSENWTRVN